MEYLEVLHRYQQQFLIYSFLYYRLDETIISDADYDHRCKTMIALMNKEPDEARKSQYYDLCLPCGQNGSGYYIEDYPLEIITIALRLLWRYKESQESFAQFIARWGYKLDMP